MKTSTQLKALIRNLSREANVESEIILRNFMMERFLERVAVSDYRNNFVLKGGMLIAAIVGIDIRSTMDMDATLIYKRLSEVEITAIIEDILNIPLDDGATFTLYKVDEIREEADYPGFRVSIGANFDRTRQILKIDITTGDFVTPKEIEYSFKLMFEDRVIHIMAYNLETVLAEKFETIITRGVTNTRMRDFYDIYIIMVTQVIDSDIFKSALNKTVEKRESVSQMADMRHTINIIRNNSFMVDLWHRYQMKFSYANSVSWEMTIDMLMKLAERTD